MGAKKVKELVSFERRWNWRSEVTIALQKRSYPVARRVSSMESNSLIGMHVTVTTALETASTTVNIHTAWKIPHLISRKNSKMVVGWLVVLAVSKFVNAPSFTLLLFPLLYCEIATLLLSFLGLI